MGGDFQAGALSAGMNELLSPYMKVDAKKSGVTQSTANEIEQAMSGFVGGVSAGAVSGESQIGIGSAIAQSATQYNRQLHKDEIKFIEENAKTFAKQLYGDNPTDEQIQQAGQLLYISGKYYNDKSTKAWEDAKLREVGLKYTKEDIKNAFSYLKEQSEGLFFSDVYKENSNSQAFFTSTQEQYKNSSWTPSTSIGFGDTSDILFPAAKIGTNVLKTTTPIVKGVASKTVDVYDDIGQRSSLYLELKAKPSIMSGVRHNKETIEAIGGLSKDGYYGTMNYLYDPKHVVNTVDFLKGFDSKYPNVTTKFPFINWHTGGFIARKILNETVK